METISIGGAVLLILAVVAALFAYDWAASQGWTGGKGL
jgi:hypothetical protein